MAGIGFALRRILEKDSYFSTLQAYLYAGLISSGPWVLSIVSVLLIGLITINQLSDNKTLNYFLVTITYLMSCSLILTSGLQLMLTRFVADYLYLHKENKILPNLLGALSLTALIAAALSIPAVHLLLPNSGEVYKLLTVMAFIILNCLWLAVIFMSGLQAYNRILLSMLAGYTILVLLSILLIQWGLNGLMAAFMLGHAFILFILFYNIFTAYPSNCLLKFDFLNRKFIKISLFFTGLLFYLGIWVDKFLFWFNPMTSEATAGFLRSSVIYDIPIFLAYLSIIPGMAVFLFRFETDFAENYSAFFDAIRNHQAFETINYHKSLMTSGVWDGIFDIIKIQALTIILLLLWTKEILQWLGISHHYETLLKINIIGVGVQIIMMAIMNVLFYLDRTREALLLAALFLTSNLLLTWLSQQSNPVFFGTGFVGAVTITTVTGLIMVNHILAHLEYDTFMLKN